LKKKVRNDANVLMLPTPPKLSRFAGRRRWQKVSLPTPLPLFARLQRSEGERKGGEKRVENH